MKAEERVKLAERVCGVMGWTIRATMSDDVIAYVPKCVGLQAWHVFSHYVASLLRSEVKLRGLVVEFNDALASSIGEMPTLPLQLFAIADATQEQTARAFMSAIGGSDGE